MMTNDQLDRATRQRQKNTERGPVFPVRTPWAAVATFIVIAYALAWLVQLPVWLSGEGMAHPQFGILTTGMMLTPAIAAIVVVRFVARPPNIPRLLGLTPLRPAGRTIGLAVLAWLGFPILAFCALLLGQAMGLLRLDLTEFSGALEWLQIYGGEVPEAGLGYLVLVQLLVIPVTGLTASISAFGEELGWRGWLLPNLRPLGTWPALLITGVVWGAWHAPVILLGYNYGRTDILGVLMMIGWCLLLGTLLGWLRLRSASLWPAVLGHGAINGANGLAILLEAGQGPEALFGSILGWSGWMVLAATIAILALAGQFGKQPQPGLTLRESEQGKPAARPGMA
jgi:membrane protease YdiL (CAAX protease family)